MTDPAEGFRRIPSRTELIAALEENPGSLEGEAESQWLDFKKDPHLKPGGNTTDSHRFELAKDVTAMANAGGGLIVWGVGEVPDSVVATRRVGELSPIPPGVVQEDQVRKVLRQWVFPTWLEVHLRERPVEGGNGSVWVIDIPPPSPDRLPFLVVKEWPREDKKKPVRGHYTMYRRSGTDNAHVPPEEMYHWLYAGYHSKGEAGEAIGRGAYPPLTGNGSEVSESADETLNEELAALEIDPGEAFFFIQLQPEGGGRLRKFWGSATDAVEGQLRSRQQLRQYGFGCFSPYARVQRTPSNGLRRGLARKGGISVRPEGLTTFVCSQDTLTWASEKHAPEGKLLVNPVALPEFTIEACQFFVEVVLRSWEAGASIRYRWRVGMKGLGGLYPVHLPRGRFGDLPLHIFWDQDTPHTAEDFTTDFVSSSTTDGGRLAFELLTEVYHHFGYGPDVIPLKKDGKIDAGQILSLKLA